MLESNVQKLIQLTASKLGVVLFRNNVGQGWIGQMNRLSDGSIHIRSPRPLEAGLHKGSSDLIGWKSVQITPDMIGKRVAIFTAVEVKAGTRPTQEQLVFIEQVRKAGGIAGIARSPEEASSLLTQITLL